MINGDKLGFRADRERAAKIDRSDEAQIMALAGWFTDHPGMVDLRTPDETDAERAIRALDGLVSAEGALRGIDDALRYALDAPPFATLGQMVAAVVNENTEVRKALSEVLESIMSSQGKDEPSEVDESDLNRWRDALARPWTMTLGDLFDRVGLRVTADDEAGSITFTLTDDAEACGECEPCKVAAAKTAETEAAETDENTGA